MDLWIEKKYHFFIMYCVETSHTLSKYTTDVQQTNITKLMVIFVTSLWIVHARLIIHHVRNTIMIEIYSLLLWDKYEASIKYFFYRNIIRNKSMHDFWDFTVWSGDSTAGYISEDCCLYLLEHM